MSDDDGNLQQPGDYKLPNIIIVSDTGNAVEMREMVIELNIYESIYSNAVTDRENASILFTDAFKSMQVGTNEHAVLGPTLTKYIERMCKSNEQILRLAELIAKSEERASKVNPEDIFAQISD